MLLCDVEGRNGRMCGREASEGGDTHIYIYICIAHMLHCTAEINTILKSNYIPIKKGNSNDKGN